MQKFGRRSGCGDIEIFWFAVKQKVADAPAYQPGRMAIFAKARDDVASKRRTGRTGYVSHTPMLI